MAVRADKNLMVLKQSRNTVAQLAQASRWR